MYSTYLYYDKEKSRFLKILEPYNGRSKPGDLPGFTGK